MKLPHASLLVLIVPLLTMVLSAGAAPREINREQRNDADKSDRMIEERIKKRSTPVPKNSSPAATRRPTPAPRAETAVHYEADWAAGVVTLVASGKNPTTGWTTKLSLASTTGKPLRFTLLRRPPGGVSGPAVTPFRELATGPAAVKPATVLAGETGQPPRPIRVR